MGRGTGTFIAKASKKIRVHEFVVTTRNGKVRSVKKTTKQVSVIIITGVIINTIQSLSYFSFLRF